MRRHLVPFAQFVTGAGVAFGANLALTYALTEWVGLHYLIAYIIVQAVVLTLGFFFQLRVVFKKGNLSVALVVRYLVFLLSITAANTWVVHLLTELAGVHYLVSITISTAFFLVVKFVLYKLFVFV
jgi:putative flippase GtrA